MKRLQRRVAIVTGAGRGLGRSYALALAKEGASILVNDNGCEQDGEGSDARPANDVAAEITALGGRAAAHHGDAGNWNDSRAMVEAAIAAFGDLHVIVNNAGIMRDHSIVEASEEDWDRVINTHLKGHMALTKWAMTHWDTKFKKGQDPKGSIVNTSSIGGVGGLGNANYSAAKSAVISLGLVAALEGAKIGVRANTVSPNARTRLTIAKRGAKPNENPDEFDFGDPANVASLIVYLAQENCPVNGGVFHVAGNQLGLFKSWSLDSKESTGRWSVEMIEAAMPGLVGNKFSMPSVTIDFAGYLEIIGRARAAIA